jgi:hypothetical protein
MAVCAFDIPFTGSAAALLERARAGIQGQGGTLTGDVTKGAFSVPVLGAKLTGTYAVTASVAHFEITAKPFLVSCGRIQSELAKFGTPPPPPPPPGMAEARVRRPTRRAKAAKTTRRPAVSKSSRRPATGKGRGKTTRRPKGRRRATKTRRSRRR